MKTTKIEAANGFQISKLNNIVNYHLEKFESSSQKNGAVDEFFLELCGSCRNINSNVIGYIKNSETGDIIQVIEEHYIDSGSVDYIYTAY